MEVRQNPRAMNGVLDNVTILRFAHMQRDVHSGGVEQYLDLLNGALLKRNRLTILQMYDTHGTGDEYEEVVRAGQGRLIWVPAHIEKVPAAQLITPHHIQRLWRNFRCEMSFRNMGRPGTKMRRLLEFGTTLRRYGKFRCLFDNKNILRIFDKYRIDLVLFHWLNYDADSVIERAMQRGIPFAIVNHFDNSKYCTRDWKRQIAGAAGVAGVSTRNVPDHLRKSFALLSDALDTEFFNPTLAKPHVTTNGEILMLPGRIVQGKGHPDVIRAAKILVNEGLNLRIVFAGRSSSGTFERGLKKLIAQEGLLDRVLFLGQLQLPELRQWYATSDVVVLPSNSEGLPRVLLEAQAMGKPVIAYDSGGVADAMVAGKTGLLVKRGDISALSGAIARLLSNRDERMRMGAEGRKFVMAHFGPETLVKRHEDFYVRCLSKNHNQD